MSPPRVRVRGVESIPGGFLIGRIDPGHGDAQLIDIASVGQQLVATGAVSPPGSPSIPATGVTAGSYTLASFTVSGDGRLSAASSGTLASAKIWVGNGSSVPTAVSLSGDATLINTGAMTLATVNSNVGAFTNASITVNAKGLVTAASTGAASGSMLPLVTGDVTPGVGPFPIADPSGQYIGVPL